MPTSGAPMRRARSWSLVIFLACISPSDPPMTVKSCAKAYPGRPLTCPNPVTTPSPGAPVLAMSKFAHRCSTNMSSSLNDPGSNSCVRRSRAVSFPASCCLCTRSGPPPPRMARCRASSWAINSSMVRCGIACPPCGGPRVPVGPCRPACRDRPGLVACQSMAHGAKPCQVETHTRRAASSLINAYHLVELAVLPHGKATMCAERTSAGAHAGRELPRRWSAQRSMAIAFRLPRDEPLDE